MENLGRLFRDRTVVIVAHRLSTVKNADNIIVLDGGHIEEQGTHEELTRRKGKYYTLVKNQLEFGNCITSKLKIETYLGQGGVTENP